MKRILLASAVAFSFATGALAADEKKEATAEKKLTPQQQRMKDCNKEARDKKLAGEERKKFMGGCLKG